jgi:hypothetical protein
MIYGKVGRLGHGKSMRMVVDGLQLLRDRGGLESPPRCWLAANIAVNAPAGAVFVQLPMEGFRQALADLLADSLAAGVGLVVLVDEVDTVWDAHEWQTMRKSDRYRIKQSRKYGCDLIWSAQFVDQVEKSIRNITEEVELLRAFPGPTISRREAGKRPFLIMGQRFRPGAVRELVGEADRDKRIGRDFHRYRREHEALYDTDEILMPANLESLCSRHLKEAKEADCPRCNAPESGRRGPLLAEFVAGQPPERIAAAR